MNIHEYQAKALLAQHQVSVPKGTVAESLEDVRRLAKTLDGQRIVIKAQVHAGGREKGGGVKFAQEESEIIRFSESLLGKNLTTPVCPAGRLVTKLLFEEEIAWEQALYLSFMVDRAKAAILITASAKGGVEVESVAKENPQAIVHFHLNPVFGYQPYQGREIALRLGLSKEVVFSWVSLLENIYRLFVEKDAMQIEINPLVLTKQGQFIALDAKMSFDENALFRHPEIRALRDVEQEDAMEAHASQLGFYYVKMDGSVGCMVNGGGLAMATMDFLTQVGERPANFMDLGGGASKERISAAFQTLLGDPRVTSVFINVFGGLSRCDRIAQGILNAVQEKPELREVLRRVPMVVRLEGIHAQEAKEALRGSGIAMTVVDSLPEGIRRLISEIRRRSERNREHEETGALESPVCDMEGSI